MKTCKISDCPKSLMARGMCMMHYLRVRRYGSPDIVKYYRHGLKNTPEYGVWSGMKRRCYNPHEERYPNYGGRGIKVCDRWLDNFPNFYKDMGSRPGSNYSIDRINHDGNYSPENCRWATAKEQMRNTTTNRLLSMDNQTLTLSEWCERYNTYPSKVAYRLKVGWDLKEALGGSNGRRCHQVKLL